MSSSKLIAAILSH